ncbi:beta-lactamase/transpeptidase-like protein [Fennellomyces sp. T-0311]|nr:beta-lactamase/transpeptidase-like protein [Fennellomyces sp. T-0311]
MTSETVEGAKKKAAEINHPSPPPSIQKGSGILWILAGVLGVISMVTYVAAKRLFNEGVFIPWRCSILGQNCEERYNVPFRGYVHPDYTAAQDAFKENFFQGEEVGAAVSAYVDGELVVDIQGGWQNPGEQIPYTDKTLQVVFSSTKALTSIVVAQFVDKGVLDYDEKIVTYWPEFAQGNKENVTLGDLMQHAGGVNYLDKPISSAECEDTERFSRILAAQPHTFGGVRTRSYHAATRGWYVNEILRRVANCTVHDVALELNQRYNIEWNLKPYQEEYDNRITRIYRGPKLLQIQRLISLFGVRNFLKRIFSNNELYMKTFRSTPDTADVSKVTDLRYRRLEGPSYSGFTNSHSIAKLAAMMANDGKAIVKGEPDLLSPKGYAVALEPVPLELDLLIGKKFPAVKGGWGKFNEFVIDGVEFTGWTGMGGSIFWWNNEHKIGFGYVMNAMPTLVSPDERSIKILRSIVAQVLKKKSST